MAVRFPRIPPLMYDYRMTPLSLATYNTYRERKGRDEALDELLRDTRTLVCLQEVSISRAWEIKRHFGPRVYLSPVMFGWEFLATILPEDIRFVEHHTVQLNSLWGFIPLRWSLQRVLTLYPGRLHGWPDGLSPRAAQVADISWRGQAIRVINTHLPYEPRLRDRCLTLLPGVIGAGEALVLGDLNATTEDLFLNDMLLASGLSAAGPGTPTHDSRRRIDYVLYRGGFREAGYDVERGRSDHRLVRVDLEVS